VNIRAALAATGVLVVVAGCTVRISGEPVAGAPESESSDTEYADLLPPRPRELNLAGVDPCKDLFTDQQLRELDYDLGFARPPLPGTSSIHGGLDCTYASNGGAGGTSRNIGSLVAISTTEGALAWVTDPAREPDARPEVVDIQGFSALVLPHPKLPDNCLIVVDTAENQYLEVSSSPGGGEDDEVEPYCAEAERVADMAIQTVSAAR
jgi:hypothetical protein